MLGVYGATAYHKVAVPKVLHEYHSCLVVVGVAARFGTLTENDNDLLADEPTVLIVTAQPKAVVVVPVGKAGLVLCIPAKPRVQVGGVFLVALVRNLRGSRAFAGCFGDCLHWLF